MGNPNCCFMIIAGTFFSPGNSRGELCISKWLLRSSIFFLNSFTNVNFFHDFMFYKSEVRTVLLEIGIVLSLLKKSYLKLAKLFLCIAIHLQDIFLPCFMLNVCYQG